MILFDFLKKTGDFYLFLQPIYEPKKREIVSYEVLSRVKINGRFLSPPVFMKNIPIQMHFKLTLAVFDDLENVLKVVPVDTKLHININLCDLKHNKIINYILKYKNRIIVEIIENSGELKNHINIIKELSAKGVSFALDDLGSKYGSYNFILNICENYDIFDLIKIDGIIIKDIDKNKRKQRFLKDIIKFMHINKQKVILEYIENKTIEDIAISSKANYLQGYYFSKPFYYMDLVQPLRNFEKKAV